MNLKEMVKDGKRVNFVKYQRRELWYVTETGFEFPIPIEDCGDGEFKKEDKALIYMRWIRKHLENIEEGKLG